MIRYALTAALLAVLSLSGACMVLMARNGALVAEKAALDRKVFTLSGQVESARLSAAVAHAYRDRERQLSANATARLNAIDALDLGECADEKIDDALADAVSGGIVPATD